jgi:hypothetical protein
MSAAATLAFDSMKDYSCTDFGCRPSAIRSERSTRQRERAYRDATEANGNRMEHAMKNPECHAVAPRGRLLWFYRWRT